MPSPGPEAFRLAEVYRLALADVPHHGPAGERLGKGAGASLEFQDRRAYVAGDDVRHLDWAAYARSDQLMVRLYREEILPRIEIVVDGSRSMAIDPEKAQLATDLVALLHGVARAGGFHVRVIHAGDSPELVESERLQGEGLSFEGRYPLQDSVDAALGLLRPGSIRVLVSDFLSPHDAAKLARPLAMRAGGMGFVQVLGREDADPPAGEALRLTDVESGAALDLVLDRRTVELYTKRLRRLQDALSTEARRVGGIFVSLTTGPSLSDLCRTRLAAEGLLAPA